MPYPIWPLGVALAPQVGLPSLSLGFLEGLLCAGPRVGAGELCPSPGAELKAVGPTLIFRDHTLTALLLPESTSCL